MKKGHFFVLFLILKNQIRKAVFQTSVYFIYYSVYFIWCSRIYM